MRAAHHFVFDPDYYYQRDAKKDAEQIERDIEKYLASGKKITVIPSGVSGGEGLSDMQKQLRSRWKKRQNDAREPALEAKLKALHKAKTGRRPTAEKLGISLHKYDAVLRRLKNRGEIDG